MGATFLVLALVELTIAKTKPDALFFAVCVLGVGLGFRAYSHKIAGLKTLTVKREVAAMVTPDLASNMETAFREGQKIMVAARGITRAQIRIGRSAIAQRDVVCLLREGNCRLLRAWHNCARPSQMAG